MNQNQQSQFQNRVRTVDVKQRTLGASYAVFVFTGMIGFHMFYLRQPGIAVSKILTGNWFLIGIIIDAIRMPTYVRQANGWTM